MTQPEPPKPDHGNPYANCEPQPQPADERPTETLKPSQEYL
ncbi:hypothetical protein [Streptomyces sp. NPDC101115]